VPTIPELAGLSPSEAFSLLEGDDLQPVLLGLPTARSDGYLGYSVATHEPAAGREVDAGTRVALALEPRVLAFGGIDRAPFARDGAPAPDVVGLEIEEAMRRVTAAGFVAMVLQPKQAVEHLTVSRQDPEPATPVPASHEIALFLD
jgi:beta-lactam-binding protein with PASTA domain